MLSISDDENKKEEKVLAKANWNIFGHWAPKGGRKKDGAPFAAR